MSNVPNFAFTSPSFSIDQIKRIDPRIWKFAQGWKIDEVYKNNTVTLPDYVPMNYYEVNHHPAGTPELERQLTIWCGWAGRSNGKDIDGLYDAEVILTLGINAADVLTTPDTPVKVNAQLMKSGGSPINVYYNNKLVTDFTTTWIASISYGWFGRKSVSTKQDKAYVTVADMRQYL